MAIIKRGVPVENLSAIHPLLADIVYNRQAYAPNGQKRHLEFEISQEEIFFVYSQIQGMEQCKRVLEIGCAMGISSLVIAAALHARNGNDSHHRIIDPRQATTYENIGIGHLRKANFSNWELMPLGSEIALPQILQKGEQYDFIFQDGIHSFDHCLLEFHYFNRILRDGGLLLCDDVDNHGVNQFIRHVSLDPHWRIVACVGRPYWSYKRRIAACVRRLVSPCLKIFPRKLAKEIFSDELLRPDNQLGLDSSMIALQKYNLALS